jgi:hypothetical protein
LSEDDQTLAARFDKIDLPKVRPVVTRVEQYAGHCQGCGGTTLAPLPEGLEPGTPCGGLHALVGDAPGRRETSPSEDITACHPYRPRCASPTCPSLPLCSPPSRTLRVAPRWPAALLDRGCAQRLRIVRPGRRNGCQPNQETRPRAASESNSWWQPRKPRNRSGSIRCVEEARFIGRRKVHGLLHPKTPISGMFR